jgi:hypothetical protein
VVFTIIGTFEGLVIALAVPMKQEAQNRNFCVFINTTRERKRDDDENGNGDIIYGDGDDGRRHLFHILSEFRVLHTSGGSVPSPNRTAISTNRPAVLVR